MTDTPPEGFKETFEIHEFVEWVFDELWERVEDDGKISVAEAVSFGQEFVTDGLGKFMTAAKGVTDVPKEFSKRKASAYVRFVAHLLAKTADDLEQTGN